MKTLKLFPAIFVILMLMGLSANSTYSANPQPTCEDSICLAIKEAITYPPEAVKRYCQGSVDLTFTINDDGTLHIESLNCDKPEFADCLKKQLAGVSCKGIKTPSDHLYQVKISFKLI